MQKAFERDVRSLANTIDEMGDPFTEDSSDLLALRSGDPAVIDTVRQIEKFRIRTVRCPCQRAACQSNKAHF